MLARSIPVLILSTLAAGSALSQSAPRELTLIPGPHVEMWKSGGSRDVIFAVGPAGRSVAIPRDGWGDIIAYDSSGAKLPWKVPTGRRDSAEIMFPRRVGWISGTNTMWVSDAGYRQVVLVDENGKVTKSIENPSWVHPHWAERRKFPVFGSMEAVAVYPDQTMLVLPGRERSFISTPSFDKSVQHLLRTTWSGAIEKPVATIPKDDGFMRFQSKREMRQFSAPFAARPVWAASNDGLRLVVVTPGLSEADSGAFRVTMLSDRGDTVFNRRYPYIAARVPQATIDQFNSTIKPIGDISAERIRDSLAKQTPAFRSYVTDVMVGYDHSTWVMLKPALDTAKTRRAMVLDARGDVAGMVTIPADQNVAAVSLDRLWAFEMGRMRTPTGIVRYDVRATGAPPARSVKVPASSTASPRPR